MLFKRIPFRNHYQQNSNKEEEEQENIKIEKCVEEVIFYDKMCQDRGGIEKSSYFSVKIKQD